MYDAFQPWDQNSILPYNLYLIKRTFQTVELYLRDFQELGYVRLSKAYKFKIQSMLFVQIDNIVNKMTMKWPIYEMSYLWNVLSFKCPMYEMSFLWYVLSMRRPIYEMSYLWIVLSMKCPFYKMSYLWNVLPVQCPIYEMSCLYNVLSMKCPIYEMTQHNTRVPSLKILVRSNMWFSF